MSYIQPTNHIQFILRPETAIIKEAFRSLDATNGGIETYPISDYLLHAGTMSTAMNGMNASHMASVLVTMINVWCIMIF